MKGNFFTPRQLLDSGVILCGEDYAAGITFEPSMDEREPTVQHVIASCIASKGSRAFEFELVTTDIGPCFRWRFPHRPGGQDWFYMRGTGLAAHYLKVRTGMLRDRSWHVTDAVELWLWPATKRQKLISPELH